MSLVIVREALDPSDLPPVEAHEAHARKTRSKSLLLAGALLALVGLTIAALRAPGSACAIGAVALVLVVVAAWLVVSVMGDVVVLRLMRAEGATLDAVRAGGFVEVLRLQPDAAWCAHALDDDVPALLLRCGERFLYLNEPLDELIEEGEDAGAAASDDSDLRAALEASVALAPAGEAVPAPPRVRRIVEVRRMPAPDGRVLEVLTGTGWLALGDLPSIADEDPHLAAIAARPEWSSAVLTHDQLPHAWIQAVQSR